MDTSSHSHLVLAVYIVTFITGLPSNLLAFYTFFTRVRQKQTPVDILLLNLTISDLVLIMFLPFKMREAAAGMIWDMPIFLCPITGFFYYSSIYISTLFLTAVSVERYLGVAFPIKYKLNRKPMYAVIASILFWFLACANCSIVYIIQYALPNNDKQVNHSTCYENFTNEQLKILLPVRLELGLLLFFIPFIITLYSYINFIKILMNLPNIQRKRKQRAIGLALATLINVCVCFAPYNISHIVGFIKNESPKWRVNALLFSTLNASLDPVVFYFSSTAFQKVFFDCLRGTLRKTRVFFLCQKDFSPDCEIHYNENNTEKSSSDVLNAKES
ncbi:free fatty acid receptor 2-like [Pelobates cultripes]|uniref:Free fatty acid receptor 2-like n=1 Tax=Pelobates cultripes TaxID=61616 RepID=A0AAD1T8X1_PELCU|nr:free fatty acid receptor 2-like [Pelobates cultripes]